jgi:spore coat polysaccharide biosynthesis protein SpsF
MVKKMKIGAIIQARLGSTRLPHKVLFELPYGGGKTVLEHIVARAEASNVFNQVLVATSTEQPDDALAAVLEAKNIAIFRGSEANVLNRYYEAAKENELDVIVRLTADNPCIDPVVIKEAVEFHLKEKNAYTKTTGLPIGMNIEVFSFSGLEEANANATRPEEKEHLNGYFFHHADRYKLGTLTYEPADKTFGDFRVTIDYPSDFALVNILFSRFKDSLFSWQELYDFRKANPWLNEINGTNFQKRSYQTQTEEIPDAVNILHFYGLEKTAEILKGNL